MEHENALPVHTSKGEIVPQDVATRAERIRALLAAITQRSRRNLEDAIQIGEELLAVKRTLAHGQFSQWLYQEFAMSRTSA